MPQHACFRTFTRVFHPVGQGAFYSESHRYRCDGRPVNLAFDCGSKRKSLIKKYVEDQFNQTPVHVMFLSHYHDDHFNGIPYLKPQLIILPLVPAWDKAILWLGGMLSKGSHRWYDADMVQKLSPDSRFIYVEPLTEEGGFDDEPYEISATDASPTYRILKSGQPLLFNELPGWSFVVVNPGLSKDLVTKFRSLLRDEGLDESKIIECNEEYFSNNKNKLRTIYQKLGSSNEYSMSVYSGPANRNNLDELAEKRCLLVSGQIIKNTLTYHEYFNVFHIIRPGCLYLGDLNLNYSIGNCCVLQKIYEILPKNVQYYLGTIQVPHHGSVRSFNKSIFNYFFKSSDDYIQWDREMLYVISVGLRNKYKHPSGDVLKKLIYSKYSTAIVNDYARTRLFGVGKY